MEFPDEDSDATQHGVKPLSLTSSTLTLSVCVCVCVCCGVCVYICGTELDMRFSCGSPYSSVLVPSSLSGTHRTIYCCFPPC